MRKLCAVYVSLACLPPQRSAALSNIFLALLFHSSDRMAFGNHLIFQPLIDKFNFLQKNGVQVDTPTFSGTIYFELGLILEDNYLGLHSITGFLERFSSNFPCRMCMVRKDVLKV